MAELILEHLSLAPDRLRAFVATDLAGIESARGYYQKLLGVSATISEVLTTHKSFEFGVKQYEEPLRGKPWFTLSGVPEFLEYGASLSLHVTSPYPDEPGELLVRRVDIPTDDQIQSILKSIDATYDGSPLSVIWEVDGENPQRAYRRSLKHIIDHTKLLLANCFD